MRKKITVLSGVLFFVLSANCMATDDNPSKSSPKMGEVLVTATKIEVNQAETGSSTTVITEEDIKQSGKGNVFDLLQDADRKFWRRHFTLHTRLKTRTHACND